MLGLAARTPAAIGSAIVGTYLALSGNHTEVGLLNPLVLCQTEGLNPLQWCYSSGTEKVFR